MLRQLICLKDDAAKVNNPLRTNHLDDFRHRSAVAVTTKVDDYLRTSHFRHRSAVAETTDFFKDNAQDFSRTNHLDDFRYRSAISETTDSFK